nr:unnamed protein product [Digitaria exilis]
MSRTAPSSDKGVDEAESGADVMRPAIEHLVGVVGGSFVVAREATRAASRGGEEVGEVEEDADACWSELLETQLNWAFISSF